MEDEKLIECVRKYEFIYNLQHPKYMDTVRKDITGKDISEQLKQPAAACKQRWQGLRDAYRRALNKKKGKTGQTARNMKKWKYKDEMSFVAPFFLERKTLDSVDLTSDDEDPDIDHETDGTDTNTLENPIDKGINDTAAIIDVADANTISTVTQTEVDNAVQNNNPDYHNQKKKAKAVKKVKAQTAPPSASAVLMAKLLEEQNKIGSQREPDELDRFFLNISDTVKKISPYQQALLKNKIFLPVSEMEIQQLALPNLTSSLPQYTYLNTYTPSPQSAASSIPASATPMPLSPDNWNEHSQSFV